MHVFRLEDLFISDKDQSNIHDPKNTIAPHWFAKGVPKQKRECIDGAAFQR